MRLSCHRLGGVLEYGSSRRRGDRSVRKAGPGPQRQQSPLAARRGAGSGTGRTCPVGSSSKQASSSNRMGGGGGSLAASGGGSSSEDDGDAAWKAAIESIASVGFSVPSSNGVAKAASGGSGEVNKGVELEEPHEGKPQGPGLKLYQVKVRNMLDDMLEKNLEIVKAPCLNLVQPMETGGGIRLFKKAPPGISMDSMDKLHVRLKRPRIVPGEEVDEKSKKFRHMLRSVVVDSSDIVVSAKKASERSLARLEAREAAAKAKAKREEERVQELKKVRGEKWLPSVARQMKEEKAWELRRQ